MEIIRGHRSPGQSEQRACYTGWICCIIFITVLLLLLLLLLLPLLLLLLRPGPWTLRSAPYSRIHQPWLHQAQQPGLHLPQPDEQRQWVESHLATEIFKGQLHPNMSIQSSVSDFFFFFFFGWTYPLMFCLILGQICVHFLFWGPKVPFTVCALCFPAVVSVDSSPGPRYHIDSKVTRFGRMETPSYSILGRGRRAGNKGEKMKKKKKSV